MTQIFVNTVIGAVYMVGMLVGAEALSEGVGILLYLGCLVVVNLLCDSKR